MRRVFCPLASTILLLPLLLGGVAGAQQRPKAAAPAAPPQPRPAPAGQKTPPVTVGRVFVQTDLGVQFFNPPETTSRGSVRLSLSGDLDLPEADRLASVQNVVAKDDQGNLLVAVSGRIDGNSRHWSTDVQLPGPHPLAKKLAWLEGDLVTYRKVEPLSVEFPLPLAEQGARRQVGDVLFEVLEYTPGPTALPEEHPERRSSGGPALKASIRAPQLTRLRAPADAQRIRPLLIGASGKVYTPGRLGSGMEISGRGVIVKLEGGFPMMDEPVVKVRLEVVYLHDRAKLLSFRVTDIPLPPERPFIRAFRQTRQGVGPVRGATAGHPLFDEKGGTLLSEVRLGKAPAPSGLLLLGFSPEGAEARTTLRWLEVEVTEGLARLESLKPGVYRVRRSYRPDEPPTDAGAGRWVNEEVRVRVLPGREVRLPPLQWVLDRPRK